MTATLFGSMHGVGREGQVITSFITEDGPPRCDCVCVYFLSHMNSSRKLGAVRCLLGSFCVAINFKFFGDSYSGKLSREKTFANFTALWLFAKAFSAKLGAWCPLAQRN